jgi:hypothetical protein
VLSLQCFLVGLRLRHSPPPRLRAWAEDGDGKLEHGDGVGVGAPAAVDGGGDMLELGVLFASSAHAPPQVTSRNFHGHKVLRSKLLVSFIITSYAKIYIMLHWQV